MANLVRRDTCIRTRQGTSLDGGMLILLCVVLVLPGTLSEAASPGQDLVAQGRYVFGAAGGCGCHTEPREG